VDGFGVEFVVTLEDPPRTGDFGRSASISTSRDRMRDRVSERTTESPNRSLT